MEVTLLRIVDGLSSRRIQHWPTIPGGIVEFAVEPVEARGRDRSYIAQVAIDKAHIIPNVTDTGVSGRVFEGRLVSGSTLGPVVGMYFPDVCLGYMRLQE